MIQENAELSIRRQCKLLGISRSEVYYTPKEPDESERILKEQILARIDSLHNKYPAMGTRKLAVILRNEGFAVGRKLVRRYMAELGIRAIYPKQNLSKRNHKEAIVPYLLQKKDFSFSNQAWSIDITYIKMYRSHMYLTAIVDCFSRKIVGWSLSDTLDTSPVLETVQEAVKIYGAPGILNSDQGSQFTSGAYKQLLASLHIRQSMDGKARWVDNIWIERWFRSLKTELIYISEFRSPRELRTAIRDYIHQYNRIRPHQSLDYAVPDDVFYSGLAA